MHLSPIKGGFPHKDQHDRTAEVAESATGIERGSVICIDDNGKFRLATAEDAGAKPLFLSLQRYGDLQAAMAGLYSPANGDGQEHPWPVKPMKRAVKEYNTGALQGSVSPAITGIHMDDGDVWEDDMFDETVDWESAKPNAPITVKDGLLTLAEDSADSAGVIGYLVQGPYKRYCNDATAVKDMMTGAYRYVIQFQCGL